MKILYIVNGLRYGGTERQLVEIIRFMSQKGNYIYLIDLNIPFPFSFIVQNYLYDKIYYIDRRKSRILLSLLNIYKICRKIKPNIIHTMDSFSSFYALPVAKLLNIKFVNGSIQHAGVSSGLDYKIEKILLKCADMRISNSKAGLEFYKVDGKILYNFIDRKRFQQTNAPLRRIIMNANFSDYKDQLTLLKAAELLIKKEDKIELLAFIGDGKNKKLYMQIAKSLGIAKKIKFLGFVSNVEKELLNYGVGVLCSTKKYKEGVSNSILEYMGAGLIAIGPNIGGIPEIITDGYNGFLYEPQNPISLYNKINYILNNKDKMGNIKQNAYKTLDERFNPQKNCELLYKWYQELITI